MLRLLRKTNGLFIDYPGLARSQSLLSLCNKPVLFVNNDRTYAGGADINSQKQHKRVQGR